MTRQEFLKTFPSLIDNYHPSQESLDRIKDVSLLIIIGASGVGKSSIIDRLGIPFVPSDVTRPPRPEEKDGVDMYFLNDYEQIISDIKAGRFLQAVAGASGDLYATRASSYPSDGWAVIPVIADVVPYFRSLGFKRTLSAFITPPSFTEWMRRIDSHKLGPEQLQKRLAEARRSFDFALNDSQTHFVLNDNLAEAVERTKDLLNGKIDEAGETTARQAARQISQSLISAKL